MPHGIEDLEAEIARLKRRLERERKVRFEAEAIAEKGLRDLYERQQELELLAKIAAWANQSTSVEDVLQFAITQICEYTQWEVGHALRVVGTGADAKLLSTSIWHFAAHVRIDEFRRVSEAKTFAPGVGLPGRALAQRAPIFIDDVTLDANFPRAPFANAAGLKSASAFPVFSGEAIVAVIEFFATTPPEHDAALLALMAQIGLQMGRAIERNEAEDRLKAQAEDLAKASAEAKAADRAKSAFLANMSHELRTPLNAIIGFSEVIRDELFGSVKGRYRDYAGDIHQSGEHLKKVLNDILDISKVEVGRMELRDEPVSVAYAMEACERIIRAMANTREVVLDFDIPFTLPLIVSDKVRLKQIFLNLMSNAVKFTPRGGQVTVSARAENAGIRIMVEDNGIGMTEADLAIALQPFGQVDSALNRRHEGTGLGLPLTKALVELHGGALEIWSAPREGTRVSVWLPLARSAAAA